MRYAKLHSNIFLKLFLNKQIASYSNLSLLLGMINEEWIQRTGCGYFIYRVSHIMKVILNYQKNVKNIANRLKGWQKILVQMPTQNDQSVEMWGSLTHKYKK